ncbi:hypothetical protein LTR85_005988 [Meristemomyces frigidus]|nr:hypothetical protein LTR85_005988 [Meristemomyces frigidus]
MSGLWASKWPPNPTVRDHGDDQSDVASAQGPTPKAPMTSEQPSGRTLGLEQSIWAHSVDSQPTVDAALVTHSAVYQRQPYDSFSQLTLCTPSYTTPNDRDASSARRNDGFAASGSGSRVLPESAQAYVPGPQGLKWSLMRQTQGMLDLQYATLLQKEEDQAARGRYDDGGSRQWNHPGSDYGNEHGSTGASDMDYSDDKGSAYDGGDVNVDLHEEDGDQ